MAYYGSNTVIEQGAAGLGEYFRPQAGMGEYFAAQGLGQPPDGPLHAYADGVVGGSVNETSPGPLVAFHDGSLGAKLTNVSIAASAVSYIRSACYAKAAQGDARFARKNFDDCIVLNFGPAFAHAMGVGKATVPTCQDQAIKYCGEAYPGDKHGANLCAWELAGACVHHETSFSFLPAWRQAWGEAPLAPWPTHGLGAFSLKTASQNATILGGAVVGGLLGLGIAMAGKKKKGTPAAAGAVAGAIVGFLTNHLVQKPA